MRAGGDSKLILAAMASLLIVGTIGGDVRGETLTPEERDGYLEWLHSLDVAYAARQQADQQEARLLYPFGTDWAPGSEGVPLRLLAVSRALASFERRPRILVDTSSLTAGKAVALARNYRHLAEYDSALVWYEIADVRDTSGAFATEIQQDALACAAALDDSVQFTRWFLETLGHGDLAGREAELVIAYRRLIARQDESNLRLLVAAAAADSTIHTGSLRYWQAFALTTMADWPGALAELRPLLHGGGLSHGLTETQRAWVLAAVPDLLVLTGDLETAAPLYEVASRSRLPAVATWASSQNANLDFLSGRYDEAGLAFSQLCGDPAAGPWRDHACEMAALTDEINRIRAEGMPHGAQRFYTP